jgi:nucleotide-binding universal stress UspA family protein
VKRSILASLTGLSSDRTVLDTAIAAARIDGGHVTALRARIDVVDAASVLAVGFPNPGVSIGDSVALIREEETARSKHAREAYDDAIRRHGIGADGPVTLAWLETVSLFPEFLTEARYHDLTVMGRDPELSAESIRTVLLASGRPLLLAPPRPQPLIGRTIAIAWKEGAEAARAVTAAELLLMKADRLFILVAPENTRARDDAARSAARLAKSFADKGRTVEIRQSQGGGAHAIRNMAYECDADMLVMGAYGHGRVREMLLGGMTEAMVAESAIPVFLFH